VLLSTTPIIFRAVVHKKEKLSAFLGNNEEKHTSTEIRAVFRVVANNEENYRCCRQQPGTFFTMRATTLKDVQRCG
jgi:hypothetical protein